MAQQKTQNALKIAAPSFSPPPKATALDEWALLPLRFFLGFTFLYAGLQKVANPNFFLASSPISIQNQLAGAERQSPIHGLLHAMLPYAGTIGWIIAFAEIAIGLGTLLGFLSRTAAIGGAVLSFNLFLAISFHSSPYFVGADIVFFLAWLPLALAPGGRQLSLDGYISRVVRAKESVAPDDVVAVDFATIRSLCGKYVESNHTCRAQSGAACGSQGCPVLRDRAAASVTSVSIERRRVVVTGATAAGLSAAAVILGGGVAAVGKMIGNAASSPSTTTTTTAGPTGTTGSGSSNLLGDASGIPVGSSAVFTNPTTGDPGIIIHRGTNDWVAYDTVCPHAGCTVGWQPGSPYMVCPCHGSQFQLTNGDVLNGPAPHGLTAIAIQERNGKLYLA